MEETRRKKSRGNGEGTVFKMPNGKWRAEVTLGWQTDENGKKKRIVKTKSGFKKRKEAVDYIAVLRQAPIGVKNDILFKEVYKKWSEIHFDKITKDTEYCYTAAYAKCRPLYYQRFNELKTQDYQAVVDACTLGRRTKQNIKAMLTCMYDFAMQNDYCEKNYAKFVKLPAKQKSQKDAFTKAERDSIWKAYNNGADILGYVLTMIYTGMRYGEISILKKENIHLDERYIIGGIKTEAGTGRIIPICEKIAPVIEKLLKRSSEKLLDIPERMFYTRIAAYLVAANVRKLPLHSCRHTCATALAESGVAPAVIQEILGHTDYSTTMQYTHVQKLKNLLDGVNKIDNE